MKHNILLTGIVAALLLQAPAYADYFASFDAYPAGYSLSYGLSTGVGTFSDGEPIPTIWTGLANGKYTSDGGITQVESPLVFPNDWVSTDLNQRDSVDEFSGWSVAPGDNWAALGGIGAPSTNKVELWTPLYEKDVKFTVQFGISASILPQPTQDTFGWTFRTATGNALLSIFFKPDADDSTLLDIYTAKGTDAPTDTRLSINTGAIYDLSVTTDLNANTFAASIVGTVGNTYDFSGSIPEGEESIGAIAATWDLNGADVCDYGNNLLLFDDYKVESIPEPSSIALGIGGLGLMAAIHRRRRTA